MRKMMMLTRSYLFYWCSFVEGYWVLRLPGVVRSLVVLLIEAVGYRQLERRLVACTCLTGRGWRLTNWLQQLRLPLMIVCRLGFDWMKLGLLLVQRLTIGFVIDFVGIGDRFVV